ncbi:MAG: hypothetical protein KC431_01150 [Myxococcales bacterium]|nr:hypothetical protein [Myxococcales bacterium]
MTRKRPPAFAAAALLVPALAFSSGCDFLDQLTQKTAVVDVFATSHGEPDEMGNLPNRNSGQLVFVNDMGWEVFVNDAIVTTEGVTLKSCDGEGFAVEFYWGAFAEEISSIPDFDVTGLGGVRADSGEYCDLKVEFGPSAEGMDIADANDTTVYLAGSAVKGDTHVDFVWKTDVAFDINVDISKIKDNRPFNISDNEAVSKKLTVAKSYTAFFTGIDFDLELSQADIDALIVDTLKTSTMAYVGTVAPKP